MSVIMAHSALSLLSLEQGDCVREIRCCGKLAAIALVLLYLALDCAHLTQGVTLAVAHTGLPR